MAKAPRTVVRKMGNTTFYSDGLVLFQNIRCSFPTVGTPQDQTRENGTTYKSWSIVGMLDKNENAEDIKLANMVINKVLKEDGEGAKVKADCKFARDGDEGDRAEYEGHVTIHANSQKRPTLRAADNSAVTPDEADQLFYGGCYVDILVQPWFFNGKAKGSTKAHPKRVSATLVTVKFRRDGEAFGEGTVDDSDIFGDDGADNGFDENEDEL